MDIFDNSILCKKCNKVMKPELISKNGFNLRVVRCGKCGEFVVHPIDKQEYDDFIKLKKKDFEVKMRMVGNSYAVSIPREIVDFMKEQEKIMDNIVRLNFEEAGRVSLMFSTPEIYEERRKSRIIKSREVRVVKNNKQVYHVKEYSDSAHPEKNKVKIFKAKNPDQELEDDGR